MPSSARWPSRSDPALLLPARIEAALREEARRAAPREACGLLLGRPVADGWRVTRAVPLPNRAADPERAFRTPAVALNALAPGEKTVGTYHSHAGPSARGSASDAEESAGGEVRCIISAHGTLRAWRRPAEREPLHPVPIRPPRAADAPAREVPCRP